MPWRLILFIVIFAVFLAFITVNLDNRCNINIGFAQFEGVPIFLTVFISFSLGLVCAAPLVLHLRKKRRVDIPRKEKKQIDDSSSADSETEQKIKQDAVSAKERFFAKRFKRKE
jgi:uncharacterized membrane protein YciS (DUF1049 family)